MGFKVMQGKQKFQVDEQAPWVGSCAQTYLNIVLWAHLVATIGICLVPLWGWLGMPVIIVRQSSATAALFDQLLLQATFAVTRHPLNQSPVSPRFVGFDANRLHALLHDCRMHIAVVCLLLPGRDNARQVSHDYLHGVSTVRLGLVDVRHGVGLCSGVGWLPCNICADILLLFDGELVDLCVRVGRWSNGGVLLEASECSVDRDERCLRMTTFRTTGRCWWAKGPVAALLRLCHESRRGNVPTTRESVTVFRHCVQVAKAGRQRCSASGADTCISTT